MFLEEHELSAEKFVDMVKDNPSDDEMIAAMKKLDS
jgi:hypothetical protein